MKKTIPGALLFLATTILTAQISMNIITHPAEAEIVLDSQSIGTSPVKNVMVNPGLHKISISKEGYRSVFYPLQVQPAREITLNFRLHRLYTIRFRTAESNLRFEWNGRHAWKNPKMKFTVEEGEHEFRVFQQDSLIDSFQIQIKESMYLRYLRENSILE